MTTTAIVTGPVSSTVSMLWHAGDPGNGPCAFAAIPLAVVMLPAGWVMTIAAGVEKDRDYVKTGSYRTPGTRRLRCVFDPFWGFPEGLPAGSAEDRYPVTEEVTPPRTEPDVRK